MKNLVILTITIIFAGCFTPKKAVDVLSRPKNEPHLSRICAERFPVKDSIIKGDSVIRFDTLWETYTDTLISEPQVIIETKIVPKTVTKWVTRTDTIVRENTAKVSVLGSQIAELSQSNRILSEKVVEISQERDGYKEQRNDWRKKAWLLLAIIVIYKAVKISITKKLF